MATQDPHSAVGRTAGAAEKPHHRPPHHSIVARTILLCGGLVAASLLMFIVFVLPHETQLLVDGMRSKAEAVATSIAQVTIRSVLAEDYSPVVDHCTQVLRQRPSIRYVVVTRADSFSLVHTQEGGRRASLGGIWQPKSAAEGFGQITDTGLVAGRVYHYSYPLVYGGIRWGWVHIGLSLDAFARGLCDTQVRTIAGAAVCLLGGVLGSLIYGRRLTRPILELERVTRSIAAGDLDARARIRSGDEVERLALSLNQMTESLQGSRQQIEGALREKEILLKEIHHRVKNNLQVICSLLSLQSGYVDDERSLGMFVESQNRVRSMSLIHERLYRSADLSQVNFAEYAEQLAGELLRCYSTGSRRVRLGVQVEDVPLGLDTAIPCGLVLNELVTNSLKYAFPEGGEGEIHVVLTHRPDGRVALTVSDNGVGLPPGLDIHNSETLGLQLVSTLADQLGAEAILGPGPGASVTFAFMAPAGRKESPAHA